MGVICSIIAITAGCIKKPRDKKKTDKTAKETISQNVEQNPPPYAQTQSAAAERLSLSSEPLPDFASQPEAGGTSQVDRSVRVSAPLPLPTTTNSEAEQPTSPSKSDGVGKRETMASDEDYSAFLDKANEDPNKGVSKTQSSGKVELKAVDQGVDIPPSLKKVTKDAFYVSDADEPFEPVGLKLKSKTLPDESSFAKLVGHPSPKDAEVSIMDIGEWDPQGQYKDIVEATREASKGSDIRVYSISRGGSRIEYWVVGVTDGKLLGAKALAIES